MTSKWVLLAGVLGLSSCLPQAVRPLVPRTDPRPAANPPSQSELRGEVEETLEAGRYTYLRLKTSTGEVWAAVPAAVVTSGAEVVLSDPMPMRDFESKTLKRRFELVMFGSGVAGVRENAHRAEAHSDLHGVQKGRSTADEGVARAPGAEGKTIADLFREKATLRGKLVTVRGQVTKVTEGVMGRTWFHVRDGTGAKATGDHDLTVTTQDPVVLGEVVSVTGVVQVERDLGSGYAFPVLVEDAVVSK